MSTANRPDWQATPPDCTTSEEPAAAQTDRNGFARQPLLAARFFRARSEPLPYPWHGDEGVVQWTTSGRAAIFAALRCAGIGRGDRVLVPAYHCPSMVAPVVALEATPVFYALTADGAPDVSTFGAPGRRPADAVIAAHLFGIPTDLRAVRSFCDAHDMVLIEDCAHAFAHRAGAGRIGTHGNFVVASLTKFFPTVEGGLLLSRRMAAARMRLAPARLASELRAAFDLIELWASETASPLARAVAPMFRIKRSLRGGRQPSAADAKADVDASFRVDTTAAERTALRLTAWLVRHSDWPGIAAARRRNYDMYSRLLAGCPHGRTPFASLPEDAVPYVFPFLLPRSDPVYHGLRARGIPVFRWDRRWPGTPELPGDISATWSADLLQLSCHQSLSEQHIGAICEMVTALAELQHRGARAAAKSGGTER
ncbi:MAG: DegT/DnrJ/EryC1/StrS family aminotransferase [Pseudomonadota bacterium]